MIGCNAVRGVDGRIYPWGNQSPAGDLAQFTGCSGDTVPIASFSPAGDSWVDAVDMAGNVWEWVADWYGEYPDTSQTNPTGPAGDRKVLRGGSWNNNQRDLRAAYRGDVSPVIRNYYVGFRCALVPGN